MRDAVWRRARLRAAGARRPHGRTRAEKHSGDSGPAVAFFESSGDGVGGAESVCWLVSGAEMCLRPGARGTHTQRPLRRC